MLTCPMCKKQVADGTRVCPRCQTDLALLVDYHGHIQEGVARAEDLTRAGRLGEAVWAYLEVLEVDPENAAARQQVGQVATAVRQFDRAAPERRWLKKLRRQERLRRWLEAARPAPLLGLGALVLLALLAACFLLGYDWGYRDGLQQGELEQSYFFELTLFRLGL